MDNCGFIDCDRRKGSACECSKLDCISNSNAKELWPIFKAKYNKIYAPLEDRKRFEVFEQVVKEAAKKNNKFTLTELADFIGPSF